MSIPVLAISDSNIQLGKHTHTHMQNSSFAFRRTCYLAGELLSHLCQRQPELNITLKDTLSVQIAALCHDLGHGPFSHLFEEVVAELRSDIKWRVRQTKLILVCFSKQKPFFSMNKLQFKCSII